MQPKTLLAVSATAIIAGLGGCASSSVAHSTSQLDEPVKQSGIAANLLTDRARFLMSDLQSMMQEARAREIDVTREESILWFAQEFLKFADWDEANQDAVEYMFEQYGPFREDAADYAEMVPDFQREKVIEILEEGRTSLSAVLEGYVTRRPVPKIDWQNIEVADDKLLSGGRPVFLYDYFSKTVGGNLTDENIYNDHLGAIFHGGQRLYEVNKDRAVNSYLLREDGTFDDERLSFITEIPDTNVGYLILWNMGIPEWVLEREPQAAMGRSLFTGFDIDNPLVRDVWGKIIRKAATLTKDKKVSQLGYILSNEPHWYSEAGHWTKNVQEMTEISDYTRNKFRAWLREKYAGDLSQLNQNWNTEFRSFADVSIEIPIDPSTRGTPIWYDWSRYNMDRSIDWFTYLQGELHKEHPGADTHLKIMPNMFTDNNRSHGIDVEALTNLTTMIGDDAKARAARGLNYKNPEEWESKYAYYWHELSMSYDFMESVSPGKIHINSETHFLSASWWRELDTDADYVRSVFWLATLQGMDVGLSWFWARDPDGSPEDRLEGTLNFFDPALAGSYAASVNMQPHVANAKTQVMTDLNSVSEEIFALRQQRRPMRIFHSETSAINKTHHMSEQFELFEALFFEGAPVGYVTQNVLETHDHSAWDVVVVYKTEFVTDAEFAALQAYLDAGGKVILDRESSLAKDEYGQARTISLNAGDGVLLRATSDDKLSELKTLALNVSRESLPDLQLIEQNEGGHKGCVWRVVQTEDGGRLVNILNIGKHRAKLNLTSINEQPLVLRNLLTGQLAAQEFELDPNGVLLLRAD